jgi:hypothetical protein
VVSEMLLRTMKGLPASLPIASQIQLNGRLPNAVTAQPRPYA